MHWTEQIIHFIDFEGSLGSGIVEYGVVSFRGADILAVATRLCRPTGRVRPEDVAVHGLPESRLLGCAPCAEDFELFAQCRESGPLAAHFAQAENTLLKSVWPYPRAVPDFVRGGATSTVEWGPWIDTGRLYPQLFAHVGSARLADLVAAFGLQGRLDSLAETWVPVGRRNYHAAPYDALAGALLLQRLAEEPSVVPRTLTWMITMSTLDGTKRDEWQQGTLF